MFIRWVLGGLKSLFVLGFLTLLVPLSAVAEDSSDYMLDVSAKCYVDVDSGSVATDFRLDCSESSVNYPSVSLEYRVDWGGGYSTWGDVVNFSHRYDTNGYKMINYQVRGVDTSVSSAGSIRVNVFSKMKSAMDFSSVSVDVDESLSLNLSRSLNSLGKSGGLEYRVNWGDGDWSAWSYSSKFDKAYVRSGSYKVVAEVRDLSSGEVDDKFQNISVRGANDVSLSLSSVNASYKTKFVASVKNKSSYSDYSYRISWDGNSNFSNWTSTNSFSNRYIKPGAYTVILEYRKGGSSEVSRITRFVKAYSVSTSTSRNLIDAIVDVNLSSASTVSEFIVDASKSLSSEGKTSSGMEYRISWGDKGRVNYSSWSDSATFSKRYSDPGTYKIVVEIRDSFLKTDSTSFEVKVLEASSPIMTVDVFPRTGDVGDQYAFTISAYSSIGSSPSRMKVRYDYDGDGGWDTDWTYSKKGYYKYSSSGVYTPNFELMDVDGGRYLLNGYTLDPSNRLRGGVGRLVVGVITKVTGSFSIDRVTGSTGELFSFDASEARVSNSSGVSYRWDFDGDGAWDTKLSDDPLSTWSYSSPGKREVSLQVVSGEEYDIVKRFITVVDEGDIPEISFSYSQYGGYMKKDSSVISGKEVSFAAKVKRDYRNKRYSYEWDFDSDGVYDYKSSRVTSRFIFDSAGDYNVKLKVSDDRGGERFFTERVSVYENMPPDAGVVVTPAVDVVGSYFTFDASSSKDDLSSYLKYRWDFDADGMWDTNFSSSPRQRKMISEPGTRSVLLEVKDKFDLSSIAEYEYVVSDNSAPSAVVDINSDLVSVGEEFVISLSDVVDDFDSLKSLRYSADYNYDGVEPVYDFKNRYVDYLSKKRFSSDDVGDSILYVSVCDSIGDCSSYTIGYSVELVSSSGDSSSYSKGGMMTGLSSTNLKVVKPKIEKKIIVSDEYSEADRAWFVSTSIKAAGFSDVKVSGPGSYTDIDLVEEVVRRHINIANLMGVVSSSDGLFRPGDSISRAEALKVMVSIFDLRASDSGISLDVFKDVDPTNWSSPYIKTAVSLGVVRGYGDDTFKPWNKITRHEAKLMLERIVNM